MSKPRRRHDALRLAFGETVRHSASKGIVSNRLGSPYVSGRIRHWLKFKNPTAPAVKREAEEDWGRRGRG
jgi:ATP-dependent DNA ligase